MVQFELKLQENVVEVKKVSVRMINEMLSVRYVTTLVQCAAWPCADDGLTRAHKHVALTYTDCILVPIFPRELSVRACSSHMLGFAFYFVVPKMRNHTHFSTSVEMAHPLPRLSEA